MLSFHDLKLRYEPYPIGLCPNVLPQALYDRLLASFPSQELLESKESLGKKYSLSEVNRPAQYHAFIRDHPEWLELYRYIKSDAFIVHTLATLVQHGVDLGMASARIASPNRFNWGGRLAAALPRRLRKKLEKARHRFDRIRRDRATLGARFEFSALPAQCGCIVPHTDAPEKMVTLVISMVEENGWDDAIGGGTEILRPRDVTATYNKMNRHFRFDEVETVDTYPFQPNQCVLFVKTFNSLHAVSPMKGSDAELMRRTLTINIERLDCRP